MPCISRPAAGTSNASGTFLERSGPFRHSIHLTQPETATRPQSAARKPQSNFGIAWRSGARAVLAAGHGLRTCHRGGQTPILRTVSAGRSCRHLRLTPHPHVYLTVQAASSTAR